MVGNLETIKVQACHELATAKTLSTVMWVLHYYRLVGYYTKKELFTQLNAWAKKKNLSVLRGVF